MHRQDAIGICLVGLSCCCSMVLRVLTDNPVLVAAVWSVWCAGLAWLSYRMWEQLSPPGIPLRMWWQMRRLGYRYEWVFKRFTHKDGNQIVQHQDGHWFHIGWEEFQDTSRSRNTGLAASPIAAHVLGQLNASDYQVADDYH